MKMQDTSKVFFEDVYKDVYEDVGHLQGVLHLNI